MKMQLTRMNGAWGSNLPTQKTGSLELTGFFLVDSITGTRDPGQLAYETAAMQVGFAARRYFRVRAITASGGEKGNFVFAGYPSVDSYGGNVTDVQPFGGTIQFDGKPVGSGTYNLF